MTHLPVPLSSVSLRLAGEVGQTALDQIKDAGVAAAAELDQHIAAIRADLAACREPQVAGAQLAGLAAGRAGRRFRAAGAAGPGIPAATGGRSGQDPASRSRADGRGQAAVSCPDVPFVDSALRTEAVVPLRLLLHYGCCFVEAAVSADWWPGETPGGGIDWESTRLAALCELVSRAEAAAALHPDLRAIA